MNINWDEIVKSVGLVSIVSGLVVWLIKQLGQHFIDRKFKAYELELKYKSNDYAHQLEKSLEDHRSKLSLVFTKASKLHDRRLEIISELYKKLVLLNQAMQTMTALWKLASEDKKADDAAENERIKNAGDKYSEFYSYYLENKVFFSIEICELLDSLRNGYYDSYWDYTAKQRFGFTDFELNYENAKKASENVQEKIPPILNQLESEFRKMIGVED